MLPGGFINYEETAEEAVKRELKEETGLNVILNGTVLIRLWGCTPKMVRLVYYG